MPTSPHTPRARACVALSVVLAALLAGCGGSSDNGVASKSASEILAASRAAATGASSVRVASKSSQGPLVITVDLELASNGGRANVSLLGLTFEAIRIENTLYVKGSPAFDKRLSATLGVHLPTGVWVKAPANGGQLAQLAQFTGPSELKLLLSTVGPVKGATTSINGQSVIELKETGKLYTGVLYVATTGKPFPVKILKHGKESGETTFSNWNQPVTLTAPANAVAIK